jgi:hypothetical protein
MKKIQDIKFDETTESWFENWWQTQGVHTDPAVMGLAFKEIAKNAIAAFLQHQDEPVL